MKFLVFALLLPLSASAADLVIPKAAFVDGMKAGLPDTFCADKTYFRTCFPGGKDDCLKEMKTAAADCLAAADKEIPAELKQPADGQTWGQKIGACAGERFEKDLGKGKVKSADCDNAEKWK